MSLMPACFEFQERDHFQKWLGFMMDIDAMWTKLEISLNLYKR